MELPNLGRLDEIRVYSGSTALGKSWLKVVSFGEKDNYFEHENAYVGKKNISHVRVYKDTSGNIVFDESSADDFDDVRVSYNNATQSGIQPEFTIVRRTRNGNGRTTQTKYTGVVLGFSRDNKGFGEKTQRDVDWKGIDASKAANQ